MTIPTQTMSTQKLKLQHGFTLVEMMISILVASLLSIAVINTFASQASMFTNQTQRSQMLADGRDSFEVISSLLRQAQLSSITTTAGGNTTTVDFTLPAGYSVWPNTTSPYSNNAIRLKWASSGNNAGIIRIANASSLSGLNSASLTTLAGNTTGSNTQITNLGLSQNISNDYSLTLTARAGTNGPQSTFQGVVMPRN